VTHVVVQSFDELVAGAFEGVNAYCWPRLLHGDFAGLARLLAPSTGMVEVNERMMRRVAHGALAMAVDVIVDDLRRLTALGRDPTLNCIVNYPRDTRGLAIATDVFSFHADRSPVETDTWLCTYAGAATEGLDPSDAWRLVDDRDTRQRMLQAYGGKDDDGFRAYLREGSFDLHHAPKAHAAAFSFGVGALWRIAVDWPGARVRPCLHRAPPDVAGEPRLLLIC
jgi:hypothetical protein